ncbi:MAG: hypothetical protein IJ719_00785 [Clostridia bacterium]|nr:hypothetical protein [Clostridia bacterium]
MTAEEQHSMWLLLKENSYLLWSEDRKNSRHLGAVVFHCDILTFGGVIRTDACKQLKTIKSQKSDT